MRKKLIHEAAKLYYLKNMTQMETAKILGISRSKVSRLLKEAKEKGYVQINIVSPDERCTELEELLKKYFHISEAIVAPLISENNSAIRKNIGRMAAERLENELKDGDLLGLAWGRTLYEVVTNLQPIQLEGLRVVQVIGGLGIILNQIYPHEIVNKAARSLAGLCFYLYAPAIVENAVAKEAIIKTETVNNVIRMYNSLDIIVLGLGTLDPSSHLIKSTKTLTPEKLENLKSLGAVGELCGRFYDINGEMCKTELNNNVIGISLEQIRRAQNVIGVVGGDDKYKALLGALRGGFFKTIITDESCATEVLKMKDKAFKSG
ncbi:Deoxyribonucleoside regulator [subsurface metagenome]